MTPPRWTTNTRAVSPSGAVTSTGSSKRPIWASWTAPRAAPPAASASIKPASTAMRTRSLRHPATGPSPVIPARGQRTPERAVDEDGEVSRLRHGLAPWATGRYQSPVAVDLPTPAPWRRALHAVRDAALRFGGFAKDVFLRCDRHGVTSRASNFAFSA